jgi:hypothetical protein
MFVAPWFILIAETGHAVITRHGKNDLDPAVGLAVAADHLTLYRWASLAALLGALPFVPAILGVMRLVGPGPPGSASGRRAHQRGVHLLLRAGVQGVHDGGDGDRRRVDERDVDILQTFMDEPPTLWVGPLFVLGNIVGTFLLGLALVRARTAGRLAGYAIMAWPVLHVLSFNPFVEVVGAVVQATGLAFAATALLRRRDPAAAAPEPSCCAGRPAPPGRGGGLSESYSPV